jgi:hypothetical protein
VRLAINADTVSVIDVEGLGMAWVSNSGGGAFVAVADFWKYTCILHCPGAIVIFFAVFGGIVCCLRKTLSGPHFFCRLCR